MAHHLNVSWDIVKDIQRRDLERRFAKPKLKHLRQFAIDEISVAKGHRYLTVVLDLHSGAVVFVGDGKGGDALRPFWKPLRRSKLRQFWSQDDKEKAEAFLNDWIARAQATKIKALTSFANTLSSHREGLLAYYDHRISSGRLEGTNNKIKTMKRQAYGFRDHEFFKLKILAIHEAKYALVG